MQQVPGDWHRRVPTATVSSAARRAERSQNERGQRGPCGMAARTGDRHLPQFGASRGRSPSPFYLPTKALCLDPAPISLLSTSRHLKPRPQCIVPSQDEGGAQGLRRGRRSRGCTHSHGHGRQGRWAEPQGRARSLVYSISESHRLLELSVPILGLQGCLSPCIRAPPACRLLGEQTAISSAGSGLSGRNMYYRHKYITKSPLEDTRRDSARRCRERKGKKSPKTPSPC